MTVCKHGCDSNFAQCANCDNEHRRKASLKFRKSIARLTRWLAPIFQLREQDGCICCGIHESITPRHRLPHNEGTGSFALCTGCWTDLPTSEKIRYYRQAYERWWNDGDENDWEEIVNAIKYPFHWRNKTGAFLSISDEF